MPVHNKEIAAILNEVADLLDIQGENEFRIRSYRNAARTISESSKNLREIAGNKKEIQEMPGIGKSMVGKIQEIAGTGKLKQLEKLRKKIPPGLLEVMKLEQMGPQRTKILYNKLNISSIEDLRKAVEEGKVEELEGFGKKTAEKIKKEIETFKEKGGSERFKLNDAEDFVQPLVEYLEKKLDDAEVAGSYRRRKETVGDIDILATSGKPEEGMEYFVNYEETDEILAKGETKSSIKLRSGLQVDLRVIPKASYGAALLYFTGSKEHNIDLRKIGQSKDYKINEYGVYKGKKKQAGKTEEEIYKKLGLRYIEPEMREKRGEIEAAKENKLPDLLTLDDIRGDLHMHTKASDGKNSLKEMAEAAADRGYDYIAITDHSKKVSMANGLDEKRLAEEIENIDKLNEELGHIRILKSIEVDILEDGSLDLSDEILKELDLVTCSVHYHMKLSEEKQTTRILKAMDNPYFNILAHPTGRMIQQRDPYALDMEKVMKEAKDRGCFLEINANPDRLDLNDTHIKMAKDMGLKLSIGTDSHSIANLDFIKYGVDQARRGWLEKEEVINTRSWKSLKSLLNRN